MKTKLKYLLDTHACIDLKNGHPYVTQRMSITKPGTLAMSSITWQELIYGACKSQRTQHNLSRLYAIAEIIPVLDYDSDAANHAGQIHHALKSQGKLIGAYDIQIAGHAVALNCVLITNNSNEFKHIEGLALEDWRKAI